MTEIQFTATYVCYEEATAGDPIASRKSYEKYQKEAQQLYDDKVIQGYVAAYFKDESQALNNEAFGIGRIVRPFQNHHYPFFIITMTGPAGTMSKWADERGLGVSVTTTPKSKELVDARYAAHQQFLEDVKAANVDAVKKFLSEEHGISYVDADRKTAFDYANEDIRALLDEYRKTHS